MNYPTYYYILLVLCNEIYIYNAVIIKKYIEIFDTILLSFYFIYIALAPLIEKSLTQLLSNIDTLWISNFILWGSLMTYNYCSWCIIINHSFVNYVTVKHFYKIVLD